MTLPSRIRLGSAASDPLSTWVPLTYTSGARSSYLICRAEDGGLNISAGRGDPSDYQKPMLLAIIHIVDPVSAFVEAIESSKGALYISRNPSASANRHRIPILHSPGEHALVPLDDNFFIFIDGERIQFELGGSRPDSKGPSSVDLVTAVGGEGDISMADEGHVQVLQSMQDPVVSTARRGRNGRDQDSYRESTPVIPETIPETVAETPVKSRFLGPGRSSSATNYEGQALAGGQSASGNFVASISRSGLIFAGHHGGGPGVLATSQMSIVDDTNLSTSDEEHETPQHLYSDSKGKQPESNLLELDSILASPEREDSKGRGPTTMNIGNSNRTSVGEPDDEKENSGSHGSTPLPHDGKLEPRVHTAKTNEPLPEAFLYEEHMKSTTPSRTYSRKRGLTRSPVDRKTTDKTLIEKNAGRDGGGDTANPAPEDSVDQLHKKRKTTEYPEVTGEGEGEGEANKRGSLGKAVNKRRKLGTEVEDREKDHGVVVAPAKDKRRGGRKTVQSQPDDSIDEEDLVATKVTPHKKAMQVQQDPQKQEPQSPLEESETQLSSVAKAAKDLSDKALQEAEEPPVSLSQEQIMLETTAEVAQQPKHTTQPAKKKAAKRKSLRASTPAKDRVKEPGDTQYTFYGETQTMDRVEVKTPRTVGKRAAIQPGKTPARKNKAGSRVQSEETGVDGEATDSVIVRTRDRYEGDAPKIVFSNSGLDGKKDIDKFLRANGAKKMDNAGGVGVNFLVVGPGELKRTPKLTVGVALGKNVVEDQWLIDSKEIGYFLDPDQYIPNDPLHEKEWGFNLQAAIERGREGKNTLLKEWTVNITPALMSQLKASGQEGSLVEMLKATGANNILKKAPRNTMREGEKTLVLGSEKGDGDIGALEKAGWGVFSTGIIALSVLRGKLDTESDEFRIKADNAANSGDSAQTPKLRRKAR